MVGLAGMFRLLGEKNNNINNALLFCYSGNGYTDRGMIFETGQNLYREM